MDKQKGSVEDAFQRYLQWKQRKRIHPRLVRGLLSPYWDGLAASLFERRYSWSVVRRTIEIARPFGFYAEGRGIRDAADLNDGIVEDYLQRRSPDKAWKCLAFLMEFLRERGVIPTASSPTRPRQALLAEYLRFLEEQRGVARHTVEAHESHVQAFLESLAGKGTPSRIGSLDGTTVSRFITDRAEGLSRCQRKSMCAALRCFLRFLQIQGYIRQNLVPCVPVIPCFKLDRVPPVLSKEDIEKILDAVDRSTSKGRRDYAILLLLATYGIRGGQLRALRLDDIDWRHDTLRVPGVKGGRDVVLPLLPSVGEAIVDYLRHGRPEWPLREIFLRVHAPMGPLRGRLRSLIEPYARKAGVPRWNPHAWRHACATRMLANGQQLKTIGGVLGHRSIETTSIYTKVDIEMLRQAALDWPEVSP